MKICRFEKFIVTLSLEKMIRSLLLLFIRLCMENLCISTLTD